MKEQRDYDMVSLKNKIAVITGGSNRTGRAIVERLAETNAQVIVADINLINAELVVQDITNKYKTEASAISLNLANANAVSSALAAVNEKWGPVNVWVNTSNLFHHKETFELDDAELQKQVSANMKELFLGCREVARHMVQSGVEGIVVNVISLRDFAALSGMSNHNEMDIDMINETKNLSDEFSEHGVSIFTIAPIAQPSNPGNHGGEISETDFTMPDDLAMLVVYCISVLSKTTTGRVIRLHGKNILINTKH